MPGKRSRRRRRRRRRGEEEEEEEEDDEEGEGAALKDQPESTGVSCVGPAAGRTEAEIS